MDNKLNWKAHIQVVKTKLSKAIGMIAKTRYFVTSSVLQNLYFSFFQSHINYNLLNWSSAKTTHLEPVRKSVKKVIRIMSFKNKYDHTSALFKELAILPFDLQVKHKQAIFMWKLSNGLILSPIPHLFFKNEQNPLRYNLPKANTEYSQRAITYAAVKLWNTELSESDRKITSLKLFNNKFKQKLLNTLLK